MGAFHDIAPELGAHGVPVLPTRHDVPSKPMVANAERLTVQAIAKMLQKPRFANANAAVTCGPRSGISVVDIDSPDPVQLDAALHMFGETMLIGQTPSGGHHLFYRHADEGRRIRPFGSDVPIDVLGDGLAVLPPSRRPPSKDKCGGSYRLIQGSWSDVDRLPVMVDPIARLDAPSASKTGIGTVMPGARNNALFRHLLTVAAKVVDFDHLSEAAHDFNTALTEPMEAPEVFKTCESVWHYKLTGTLRTPGCEATGTIRVAEQEIIGGNADAGWLLMRLRIAHGWRNGEPFALANAMADSLGWNVKRFKKARDFLMAAGFIECRHPGGKGPNDPPKYCLSLRWSISTTNITTPSPPDGDGLSLNQSFSEKEVGARTSDVIHGRFQDQSNPSKQILADRGSLKGAE
ncbi:bifunctional DNA primase/polymerase [Hwanghaeella sp.]|uniref:bifunctional DNA primase/polymerase n=1 Tax=Hwanghaeella sp. TaxID=2605943 RepID=UPI003CCB926A